LFVLYHGGGATVSQLFGPTLPEQEWAAIRDAAGCLLATRGALHAAKLLEAQPFELLDGTNHFGDEFSVLSAMVPLDDYLELVRDATAMRHRYRQIAETVSELGPFVRFVVCSVDTRERVMPVSPPSPRVTSEAVDRALGDAEQLIRTRGAASAVDRVHTALHGHLRAVLEHNGVEVEENTSITALFGLIRRHNLVELGDESEDVARIIRAMSAAVDSLNAIRNQASAAHPSDVLLAEPEAMLAINAARTILRYIDDKLGG